MRLWFHFAGALLAVLGVLGLLMASPLFEVLPLNAGLNVLHLLTGCAASVAALRGIGTMRQLGKLLGFTYLAFTIAAFTFDTASVSSIMAVYERTGWLHLLVACIFLYQALFAPPPRARSTSA